MIRGVFAILMVAWSFVGLPALCEAGDIAHACDCVPGAMCEHEDDCPDDPCGGIAATNQSRGRNELSLIAVLVIATLDLASELESEAVLIERPWLPEFERRPYPASDLPFRI